jgi:hypothetical protein
MAKDRHRRMAQTLGCLVASMTAGAVLLHWVQPKPDRSATQPAELVAHSIKQQWRYIRIDPARKDGRIDPQETHFFVDREGALSWTQAWQTQSHLGQNGVVRIALQPSANTNKVTPMQWQTTRWLMNLLCDKCRIPERNIVLADTLAIPPANGRKGPENSAQASVGQLSLGGSR